VHESKKQIEKKTKVVSLGFIAAILGFLLIVYALWQITDEIVIEKKTGFDMKVFEALSGYTSPFATDVMLTLTFFGSALFILPAYFLLAGIVYYFKRNRFLSIAIIVIGLFSRLLLFIIKNVFRRERPLQKLTDEAHGFSYPSGHSFSSFAFYGLVLYFIWKTELKLAWKWLLSLLLFLFAASIAFSRVYLHVHFASDVLAGFCLSLIWLGVSLWILERTQKQRL
jgi:membrane-associated phospholipid phosphatase